MAIEPFPVSRHPEYYQAWPDLARSRTGRLVCCFNQCRHHGDRSFARFVVTVSDDRGRSWSEPRPLVDTSALEGCFWNCPRVVALTDGRLAITGDHIAHERSDPTRLQNFLWFSEDDGESWSEPVPTPVQGIVPDKLVELSSGRWLLAAHRYDGPNLAQRVWWTDDQGASWHGPAVVAKQAGLNLCEASLVELPDGLLVAHLRENSMTGLDAYKSFSADGGESWDGPYRTMLSGCHRPVVGRLNSGRYLICYRYVPGGRGGWGRWTQNFFGAVMDEAILREKDRTKMWARIRPLDFDRHAQSDLGYSGWVQYPDGEIIIVTYLLDDWPRGQIRGYRLTEADFGEFAR